jgi:hypothetical protein
MWCLWNINWRWDRFFSEFIGYALSKSLHRGSPYSYITWGTNNRPIGGRSSETYSHSIDINTNMISNLRILMEGLRKSGKKRYLGIGRTVYSFSEYEIYSFLNQKVILATSVSKQIDIDFRICRSPYSLLPLLSITI